MFGTPWPTWLGWFLSPILTVVMIIIVWLAEIRPSKKREWEYYFFVDFVGHRTEERVQIGMEESRQHCLQLSILGSFPRATELL